LRDWGRGGNLWNLNQMAQEPRVGDVSNLLANWRLGAPDAEARLLAAVQGELRRIAAAYMRRERPDHTLQPTALVNEAYLRLVGEQGANWEGRAHFYGIAARVMRQVLVDHARKRHAIKRGAAKRAPVSVSKVADPAGGRDVDVLALHVALEELAALDPRQAQIVELRYFGGLTEVEVAEMLKVSPVTVRRDVASAKFFLGRRMRGD
jgi:RNA polymerase sigma factor (TIGR02999 family)